MTGIISRKDVRLEDTDLFGSLRPSRLATLRSSLSTRPFRAGEYLYLDLQPARHLWVVRVGEVRTLKASPSGRITTLEQIGPGGSFGMAAVVGSPAYGESAQGIVAGEVWRVPDRVFSTLLAEEPRVGRELLALVASRLQNAHDRLCSFAHDSVPARMARVILTQCRDGQMQVTRRALGEAVGTTVETSIRVLRSFERSGWIEGGVGWIRVLEPEALEKVAEGERPPD